MSTGADNAVGPIVATQADTIKAILERSNRDHVPVRRAFVQQRRGGGGAGMLAAFVSTHRGTALDLYLLAHALASDKPYDVALPAAVWARAVGLRGKGAESAISKNWRWLEDQRLIKSERRGRMRAVTLLHEDGSGARYRHPATDRQRRGDYFKVPYAYWEGNFANRLGLAAKAVLLIALSLQMEEQFTLPRDRASAWYGISAATIQRGLADLLARGIVRYQVKHVRAPLSPRGYTTVRLYRLFPPFREVSAGDAWRSTPVRTTMSSARR